MSLASLIDHTLLKPDSTGQSIEKLCEEAIEHSFRAVCVSPYYASLAIKKLQGTDVRVATVIGFPMGYSATVAKVEEIKRALNEGVSEVDVVINVNAVKNGDWAHVRSDIDSMTRSVHMRGKVIKIILETALLTEAEMKKVCEICAEVEPDFVKTSTGFNGGGATVEHVRFLREHLPKNIKIKASGGIRTTAFARELQAAGADRIGTSSGPSLVAE